MRALIAPLAPTLALGLGLTGCDILESATATTIVAGTVVRTPDIRVEGFFDVQAEVVASALVAERENATSTDEPTPISGANAAITFSGNRVQLVEQSTPGLYLTTSVDDPSLVYVDGSSYTVRASLPGDATTEFGGQVTAPNALTPAAITLSPQPTESFPGLPDVLMHPKSTALNVRWPSEGFGRYAYLSVYRADVNDASNPVLVFDNAPETAGEIIEFIVGTPPESLDIPADTFAEDGLYGVVLFTLDRHERLLPNTFIGSPVLAGSGAAIVLAVGQP